MNEHNEVVECVENPTEREHFNAEAKAGRLRLVLSAVCCAVGVELSVVAFFNLYLLIPSAVFSAVGLLLAGRTKTWHRWLAFAALAVGCFWLVSLLFVEILL